MPENKPTVSWVYELDKEGLSMELHERGLSIVGTVAVLRERLVKAIRSASNPTEPSTGSSQADLDQTDLPPDTRLKNPNSGPVVGRVSIATQTELSLPYFYMLDDLIEAGQLPGYSQDQRDR